MDVPNVTRNEYQLVSPSDTDLSITRLTQATLSEGQHRRRLPQPHDPGRYR